MQRPYPCHRCNMDEGSPICLQDERCPGYTPPTAPLFDRTYCSQCGGEFGPGNSGFSHCRDHQPADALPPLPEAVEAAVAELLEMQFKLGMLTARNPRPNKAACRPAADAIQHACDAIRSALRDERERWTEAVMLELDSNGQAHAIVADATRA